MRVFTSRFYAGPRITIGDVPDEFLGGAALDVVFIRGDAWKGNEMLDLTPATGMLTRLVTDIGLTGRDPAWRPGTSRR